jgi:hypothetical protein
VCKTSHSIGAVYGISFSCAQHSDLQTVGGSATETERATSEGPQTLQRDARAMFGICAGPCRKDFYHPCSNPANLRVKNRPTMPAGPAGGAFGGGSRPLGGGWPPRTNASWNSDVGGAGASVGPAPTNGEKTRDLGGGAAVGLGETLFQPPPPPSSSTAAAASGEGSDSVRFFAIGDWGNPSRRLKKVARVMSVRPLVW